jgi:hypothetical protein
LYIFLRVSCFVDKQTENKINHHLFWELLSLVVDDTQMAGVSCHCIHTNSGKESKMSANKILNKVFWVKI